GSFGCRMENMADAMQKMAAGHVRPVVDTEAGFDDIHRALERMEGRDVFGKIILRMPLAHDARVPAPMRSSGLELGLRPLRSRLQIVEYWLVAQAAMGAIALLRLLPMGAALGFADRTARRFGPLFGRHRVALYNLRRAFPEKSEAEIRKIALDMWGHMARLA